MKISNSIPTLEWFFDTLKGTVSSCNISEFRKELWDILMELQLPQNSAQKVLEECSKYAYEARDEDGYSIDISVTNNTENAKEFLILNETSWLNDIGNQVDFEQTSETATFLVGDGTFGYYHDYLEGDHSDTIEQKTETANPSFNDKEEFAVLSKSTTTSEKNLVYCRYTVISLSIYIPA